MKLRNVCTRITSVQLHRIRKFLFCCVCYQVSCVFVDEVYRQKKMPPVRRHNICRHTVILPLNLQTIEEPTSIIIKTSAMVEAPRNCKIIIWDECTMAHKRSLKALDRTFRDLRSNQILFRGAMILLSKIFPKRCHSFLHQQLLMK